MAPSTRMAKFVNYNKRSLELPSGCKDLIDLLKPSNQRKRDRTAEMHVHGDAVRKFVLFVLSKAHEACATDLIIGVPSAKVKDTTIRYKVGDAWHDMEPFSSVFRPNVVGEPGRMAGFSKDSHFPKQGVLEQTVANTQLQWRVLMATAGTECILTRIDK